MIDLTRRNRRTEEKPPRCSLGPHDWEDEPDPLPDRPWGTTVLSTAELLLGLTRHLRAYTMGPERAALGQLEFAGNVLDLALRLRGSGTSPGDRVIAIATDAGIDKRRLMKDVLPTLEALGLVDTQAAPDGRPVVVIERLPPLEELLGLADSILIIAMPEPVELALLKILDLTTIMPETRAGCIEAASVVASEEIAERALGYLEALHLCSHQRSAEGVEVIYNPNVWSADADYSAAALRAEDGNVRAALTGLIEEISGTAGLPQDSVTSTERKWVDYAVAQGLVLRSIVQTTEGAERAFLFTPHMGRSAFEAPTGADPSGHVRQLIGSMVFARTYASNRLWSPTLFLQKLVRHGEAGDASSIGTDYPMLELAGIVRVEPGPRYSKFVLLQGDVAEDAITYLNDQGGEGQSGVGLRDQRRYRQPEAERAQQRITVAATAESSPAETQRLMAALRQEVGRRRYGR